MKADIRKLEDASRELEPDADTRRELIDQTKAYGERFVESIPLQKAYELFDESVDSILNEPISETPGKLTEIIHDIENRVVPPGLNPASGGHFGYIPGGGLVASAAGDYLAALTNRYAGVYFSSPGAVNVEHRLINWMAELIGYPETSGGYLASGGSLANLTAVVTAREAHNLQPGEFHKAVVYLTDQTHHCVDRALNIAGMGNCVRRTVPMDDRFRMNAGELKTLIRQDRENGLNPWLIVASAGTTDTGAVDPLDDIAGIAGDEKLWFHVDAAYGGFFMLTEEGRELMKGIEKSDSAVLDPHKGLFLPYGLGALVVRDVELLAEAHRYHADYMQDTKTVESWSPADLSPELSKHFRGLRLWIPLKLHGLGPFRAALEEKLLLTKYAWKRLKELKDFDVGPEPQLSVFMFRFNPNKGNPDELNRKLHKKLIDDGRVFLSTTMYKGQFMLRMAILSVRSHLEQVDQAIDLIEGISEDLREG